MEYFVENDSDNCILDSTEPRFSDGEDQYGFEDILWLNTGLLWSRHWVNSL